MRIMNMDRYSVLSNSSSTDSRWSSFASQAERQRKSTFPAAISAVTAYKQRRCLYGEQRAYDGRQNFLLVDSSLSHDLRGLRIKRHFSEDSGVSSSESSTSSFTEDERLPRQNTFHYTDLEFCCIGASVRSRSQSRTVAAVLAAGVSSDSEDADQSDSDEGMDNAFRDNGTARKLRFAHLSPKPKLNTPNESSMASQIRCFLSKIVAEANTKSLRAEQEEDHSKSFKRDILDLGTNLTTKFPLRATELPEKNLPLFLQNRSQYHRLGKFGTSESFPFVSCKKKCGFSFPVPPTE